FFLTEKPGKIKFLPVANDSSPFTNYQLTEVYDFKSEKAKLDANVKHEVNELRDLYLKYGKDIFEGRNQILSDEFFKLEAELYRKIIEFIKENSKSYYSFWYYMRNAQ